MFNLQPNAPELYVYREWRTYHRTEPCQNCVTPYSARFALSSTQLPETLGHSSHASFRLPLDTPARPGHSASVTSPQLQWSRADSESDVASHVPFSELMNFDYDDLKSRIKDPELRNKILAYKQGIQCPSLATQPGLPVSPRQASSMRTPDSISRLGSNQQSWTKHLSPREGSIAESEVSTDGSVLDSLMALQRESNPSFDFAPVRSPTLPSGSFDRNVFECLCNMRGEEQHTSDTNIFSSDAITNGTVLQFPEMHTNELVPEALYSISDSVSNLSHIPLNFHPSRNGVEEEDEETGLSGLNEREEPWKYLECVAEPESLPSTAALNGSEPVIAPKPPDAGLQVEIPQLLLRSRRVFRSQVVHRNTRSTLSAPSNDDNISADNEMPSWRAIKRAYTTELQHQRSLTTPLVPLLAETDVLAWAKSPKRLKRQSRKHPLPFPEPELMSLPATRGEKMAKLHLEQALRFKHQLTR